MSSRRAPSLLQASSRSSLPACCRLCPSTLVGSPDKVLKASSPRMGGGDKARRRREHEFPASSRTSQRPCPLGGRAERPLLVEQLAGLWRLLVGRRWRGAIEL